MASLTREQILAADDLKLELLPVPEWGGVVYIRVMTGIERDSFEEWCVKTGASYKGIRASIAARCVVDQDGKSLFTDADVEALNKKSGPALDRIMAAVQKLNAVTDEDITDLSKN